MSKPINVMDKVNIGTNATNANECTCPKCQSLNTTKGKLIYDIGDIFYRKRKCLDCGFKFMSVYYIRFIANTLF